jgi:hypothetical protein
LNYSLLLTHRETYFVTTIRKKIVMASSIMASVSLKPTPLFVEKSSVRGLPNLSKRPFRVVASGGKKIKTDTPYGN